MDHRTDERERNFFDPAFIDHRTNHPIYMVRCAFKAEFGEDANHKMDPLFSDVYNGFSKICHDKRQ